eukprot:TRINITY_DN11053_c0_g1_i4.p1 TRINITY_DN11053_c0_g1~~TRINITY_DN11053_c0_g1_i4.p1  ORF type:complete len:587 (+),score=64.62 TRINITY_DN11053_c0_g1_i4:38-1762(+)
MSDSLLWLGIMGTVLGTTVLSACLLFYYTKENWKIVRPTLSMPVLLSSFIITMVPIGLLVVDIAYGESHLSDSTNNETSSGSSSSHHQPAIHSDGLLITWRVIFWSTQALSWVILPILQEYSIAGEFTTKAKIRRAVKENLKLYLGMGTVLVLLLLYVAFVSKQGLTTANCIGLAIAASNAFGLILIVLFLGYGLTQLPRSLWYHSSREYSLEYCTWSAPAVHEHHETTKLRWADLQSYIHENRVKIEASNDDPNLLHHLDLLMDLANTDTSPRDRRSSYVDDDDLAGIDATTQKGLVKLHAKTIYMKNMLEQVKFQWKHLVDEVETLEDMSKMEKNNQHPETLKEYYHIYFRKTAMRVLSIFCGVLSVILLWSFGVATPLGRLSVVEYLVIGGGNASRMLQIVSLLILLPYAGVCCYWGLFKFKLFEFNLLVPSYSSVANLCFTATFLCRLILPLCYSFLIVCGLAGSNHHIAYTAAVVEDMNTIKLLGESFNRFLPCIIIAVSLGVVTDLIPKVLRVCGLEVFSFSDFKKDTDILSEGREILSRERNTYRRNVARSKKGTNPLALNEDDGEA